RLCRNSVHGSTGSPRTDGDTPKFKDLAVRPEALEGRTAKCETVCDGGEGEIERGWSSRVRVAIVSDTHGFLDPRIAEIVALCDVAVHAGDIGGAGVLKGLLPQRRKVLAVRGNNDTVEKWPPGEGDLLHKLPFEATMDLPGGRLVVVHGDRAGTAQIRHDRLRRKYPSARAIVYGHSHRLICDKAKTPWVLNPGSAGRSRTFGGPSCLLLVASQKNWRVEKVRFKNQAARR
ncbi:MAG: metallophosphoesterase family protein, partial [Candidatus Binatia bacterium]